MAVRMDAETVAQLDTIADNMTVANQSRDRDDLASTVTRSDVVREAVRLYLKRMERRA